MPRKRFQSFSQLVKTQEKGAEALFNELWLCARKPEDVANKLTVNANTTLWLARTAVPVSVDKGEPLDRVLLHTQENFGQISATAQEKMSKQHLDIYLTTLTKECNYGTSFELNQLI